MRRVCLGAVVSALLLTACSDNSETETPTLRLNVEAAPAVTVPIESDDARLATLSPAVEDKIADIRNILERNSLRRLVNLANEEPAFVSNFAGESHRVYWDLLRRTGFDPLLQLGALLDGPYGTRQVGDQLWYIWPELAALESEDLLPERLSFADRARLLELVGEPGIARIREGQGYPGVRTAIAEDGRWLYFVQETEDDTEDE